MKIQNCFEPEPYAVAACEEQYKKYLRIQKGLRYITDGTEM